MSKGNLVLVSEYAIFLKESSNLFELDSGTLYTEQCCKTYDSFPYSWVSKKWNEGYQVTSMATSGARWAVVMSRGAGFLNQLSP